MKQICYFFNSRFILIIFVKIMAKTFTTVKVKTKPHIKHYLETQFGSPCVIPSGHFIAEHLNVLLSRPMKDDNAQCIDEEATVIIALAQITFKRYGFGLTKTNRKNFNLVIDNFIKSQIRAIADNILLNNSINEDWKKKYQQLLKENKQLLLVSKESLTADTLKNFRKFEPIINKRLKEHQQNRIKEKNALMQAAYDCLGFDESLLSFDAIQKDYYRYKKAQKP